MHLIILLHLRSLGTELCTMPTEAENMTGEGNVFEEHRPRLDFRLSCGPSLLSTNWEGFWNVAYRALNCDLHCDPSKLCSNSAVPGSLPAHCRPLFGGDLRGRLGIYLFLRGSSLSRKDLGEQRCEMLDLLMRRSFSSCLRDQLGYTVVSETQARVKRSITNAMS